MSLIEQIRSKTIADGELPCWWLGGSGFVVKTHAGTTIFLDPYLSHSAEEIFGIQRAFPPPIEPGDVRADVVISSHWHEDHLDPGSIPAIARNNPQAKLLMPPSAMARALSWGVRRSQIVSLQPFEPITLHDVTIEPVPARHEAGIAGWEVPDAVGVLLQIAGRTIYHSGDTEYDVRLRRLKQRRPDAAMLCINGVGGNMDAYEAALLAWHLGSPLVIPMHHLLWAKKSENADETLDPTRFADTYRRLGGTGHVLLPQVGLEFPLISH